MSESHHGRKTTSQLGCFTGGGSRCTLGDLSALSAELLPAVRIVARPGWGREEVAMVAFAAGASAVLPDKLLRTLTESARLSRKIPDWKKKEVT